MPKPVKVLSIDGGGIRGLIPAMVLAEIEKRTGKRIAQLFDLIAGTSTGGILALGLTKPGAGGKPRWTAEQGVELYREQGGKIFDRSVWHRIRSLGNLAEEKYPAGPIEEVLQEFFGNTRLSEALKDVIVTSYEIERRIPFFFKSRYASDPAKKADYDFPMWQVARATSAAPTYFEPFKIDTNKQADYWALIDGGVFANNPAMCAYAEAKATRKDAQDFLVVSLGTGELTRPLPYDQATGWGLALWAQPILSVMFDGVSDTVDYQLQQMLPTLDDGKPRYYRFQVRLDEGSDDMDDASRTNLRVLQLIAEDMIQKRNADLSDLCARLTAA